MEWGFWTLGSSPGGDWILCFVKEIAPESGRPLFPKLDNFLIKTIFLPHQSLFYACVQPTLFRNRLFNLNKNIKIETISSESNLIYSYKFINGHKKVFQ